MRFVVLDSVNPNGGQNGSLDRAQFSWLRRTLTASKRRLVVVASHHTSGTMNNAARARGSEAPRLVAELLRHQNVIPWVNGHTHTNSIWAPTRKGGGGFWEINTASHIDWPQQSRLLEITDNRDDTLSIFATMVDHGAPLTSAATSTPDAARRPGSRARGQRLAGEGRPARCAQRPQRRAPGAGADVPALRMSFGAGQASVAAPADRRHRRLAAAGVPDRGGDALGLEPADELALVGRVGRRPLRARRGVEGDQVDVHPAPVAVPAQHVDRAGRRSRQAWSLMPRIMAYSIETRRLVTRGVVPGRLDGLGDGEAGVDQGPARCAARRRGRAGSAPA